MAIVTLTFSIYQNGRRIAQPEVRKNIVKIGRHRDADLLIDDPYVAEMHAMLEVSSSDDIVLIDLSNTASTALNGSQQTQCKVKPGDQIQIGSTLLVLESASSVGTMSNASAVAFDGRSESFLGSDEHLPWAKHAVPAAAVPSEESVAYTYQLLKSGPEVAASEVESEHAHAVEVSILWGHNILTTQHLSPARSFYVGEETSKEHNVDFFLPQEKLGTPRLPLVLAEAGTLNLVIPPGANGTFASNGEPARSLAEISSQAAPCAALAGATQWPLPQRAEARIELNGLSFVIRTVSAAKPIPRGLVSNLDWDSAAYFGASFLAAGTLLAAMAFFVPPMGLTHGETSMQDQLILLQQYQDALAEREEEPDESTAKDNQTNEGGTGERTQDSEGAMGKKESQETNKRYAVKGDANNPDPHLARDRVLEDATRFGMIGLLSSATGDPNSPTAPWGRDTSLGLDEVSAEGNMWGDEIGESRGSGGFGLTGVGEGGGGFGVGIGLGPVGTFGRGNGGGTDEGFGAGHGRLQGGHKVKSPVFHIGQTTISGRLPPQVIQRIVRQNFGRFRHCYENGLSANPNLQGRVSVRFVIDRGGAVSNAASGGSSLPNAEVVSCVVGAFYGLSFPKPEGGIVTVSYPITFSPG